MVMEVIQKESVLLTVGLWNMHIQEILQLL